jgi:protoheme IX farnesyltransferase
LDNLTEYKLESSENSAVRASLKDYMMLSKFRLSTTVVGTTLIAYFLGTQTIPVPFLWTQFIALAIGGMLVVAAANGFNQIYEKDSDKLMSRTQKRPLADLRMTVQDAIIFSTICAIVGLLILLIFTNARAAFLSLVSIFVYTLAYTPMKHQTPFAVFVGAIPGALPPAIGWVAASGNIDVIARILFLVQLIWQFPHFWAIAWMLEDDYRKANYTLLPNYEGRTKKNADKILIYSMLLVLISMYPIVLDFGSLKSLFVILPLGIYLIIKALALRKDLSIESAKKLMYSTLFYMPGVLLSYLL